MLEKAPDDHSGAALDPQRLFAPWANARGILLAVSGGPDSMALFGLAAHWHKTSAATPPLFAATVDHGLRAEAAAECELVAATAQRLSIPHAVLPWAGPKPAAGVQEAAREARYNLLEQHAKSLGADVLMTAHHADDQAETVLFRLLRGSGPMGLAAMRPSAPRGALRLARPLLDLRKQQLVDWCHDHNLTFAQDRSNEDPRYARTRLRRVLQELEGLDLGAPDWARLAGRLARAEDALSHYAAIAGEKYLRHSPEGTAELDMGAAAAEPREIQLRLLGDAVASVAGNTSPRLERLETALERIANAKENRVKTSFTLGGCQLRLDREGLLRVTREPLRRRGRPI